LKPLNNLKVCQTFGSGGEASAGGGGLRSFLELLAVEADSLKLKWFGGAWIAERPALAFGTIGVPTRVCTEKHSQGFPVSSC